MEISFSCFDTDREVVCGLAHIWGPPQNYPCKNNPRGYLGATFVVDWRMKDNEHLNLKDTCAGSECVDQSCLFMALGLL